jgi:hypothetical protein
MSKKDAVKDSVKEKDAKDAKPVVEQSHLDIAIALLRLAASENEPRFSGRALRKLTLIRFVAAAFVCCC